MQEPLKIGASASLRVEITPETIEAFAAYSGDDNPLHMDADFARSLGFTDRVAHGMSYASLISTLIGKHLPGPGALWASQTIRFLSPTYPGDELVLSATVIGVDKRARTARLAIEAIADDGRRIMEGESEVMLPRPRAADAVPTSLPGPEFSKAAGERVALITGASGELGAAIARALSRGGFRLGLAGRNVPRLESLVEEIGAGAASVSMDLTNDDSVDAAIGRIEQDLGSICLVVHAVSMPLDHTPVADLTPAASARHFDIQAGGLLRLAGGCLPGMKRQGSGLFVFIGSTAVNGAPPKGMAAYTAAKAAGASIARSIGLENAPYGIRANIVSPHFLAGGLNAHVSEKARKLAAAQTPMRRLAELKEIADAVAFLASDGGNFINGHDLVVDGGVTMA
jgi:3-oxoacyl-[acyl-carrier protein] reductase